MSTSSGSLLSSPVLGMRPGQARHGIPNIRRGALPSREGRCVRRSAVPHASKPRCPLIVAGAVPCFRLLLTTRPPVSTTLLPPPPTVAGKLSHSRDCLQTCTVYGERRENGSTKYLWVVKLENVVRNLYLLSLSVGSQGFQYKLCGSFSRDYNSTGSFFYPTESVANE